MISRAAEPESTPAPMRVGLVYEQPGDYPDAGGAPDRFAEFEPESTIALMELAVRSAGHIPCRTGAPRNLFLTQEKPDVVWNIAEGIGTRNREAWAPVLCELLGIPFLGSDAYALSVTLDKVRCKQVAGALGIPVTPHRLVRASAAASTRPGYLVGDHTEVTTKVHARDNTEVHASDNDEADARDNAEAHASDNDEVHARNNARKATPITTRQTPEMPLLLKPRYGGTAMGIGLESVVHNETEFAGRAQVLLDTYSQDIIAEPFLPGAEFTCAVAGYPLRALPVLERGLHPSGIGSHAVSFDGTQAACSSASGADDRGEPGGVSATGGQPDSPDEPALQKQSGKQTGNLSDTHEHHTTGSEDTILSHSLTPEREAAMAAWTLALCEELEIHDFARADFKCDAQGTLYFLEINPLPTFATDSTFAIVAELEGVSYEVFLGNLLSEALKRIRSCH